MKQIRVVALHNGIDNSVEYAQSLFRQMKYDEVHTVNIYDTRPIRDVLPIRVVPAMAFILFADTLEEQQEVAVILSQLNLFKQQEEVSAIVDELVEVAGENIPDTLSEKIVNTFYGGMV